MTTPEGSDNGRSPEASEDLKDAAHDAVCHHAALTAYMEAIKTASHDALGHVFLTYAAVISRAYREEDDPAEAEAFLVTCHAGSALLAEQGTGPSDLS